MKKRLKIPFIVISMLLFGCYSSDGQITSKPYRALLHTLYKKQVPLLSCDGAQALQEARFLDTRSKSEYAVSHIPYARWVGYEEFSLDRVKDIPKDAPLVVYCSVGVRSEEVGKKMLDAGYTRVYNLYGSLFEWVNQDKPIVDSQEQPTSRVHAYSPAWGIWLRKGEKVYE
ncbi:rhodanese-like domain-containing protein [Telluribacter sp.]|jgi:rhodanese-related sulfurtransferase|uniref:rhodanese-like domain-containing protein n=1 Tax=Telluribacter sp. TaxID=1978767 RepID=UPI002E14AE5A|nr:rhodanese-like domain-containing protein [Telluribacter sp.]